MAVEIDTDIRQKALERAIQSLPPGTSAATIVQQAEAFALFLQSGVTSPAKAEISKLVPAVPIKHSVTDDYIVCLETGEKFKSMRRHLTSLGLTPEEYRAKWGLPSDYPIVAKNYSAERSKLARANGLGNRRKAAA